MSLTSEAIKLFEIAKDHAAIALSLPLGHDWVDAVFGRRDVRVQSPLDCDLRIAGGSKTLAGFTFDQMIWYLVATETIIMSMTPIHRHIEREIREGDVAIRLNKPYSFLGFHWSVFIGEGVLKALVPDRDRRQRRDGS
jgi:hypothetical protein